MPNEHQGDHGGLRPAPRGLTPSTTSAEQSEHQLAQQVRGERPRLEHVRLYEQDERRAPARSGERISLRPAGALDQQPADEAHQREKQQPPEDRGVWPAQGGRPRTA